MRATGTPQTDRLEDDRTARARLLREAAALFARKGYAATSVGEIVAAAGVTKPVLYYHFESKAGLCRALLDEAIGALRPEVDAALRGDGRTAAERIRALCQAIVRTALANIGTVRLMRALHYAPAEENPELDLWEFPLSVMAALERLVRDGVGAGEFALEEPETLAWAILGLVNVCVDSNLLRPRIALAPARFTASLDLLLARAAVPAPRRRAAGAGAARTPKREGDR